MKETTEIVHYPELKFVRFCKETYCINRGVFNVVDEWLFNQGFINVVNRRKVLLDYLEDLHLKNHSIKFGKGGVKETLELFIKNRKCQSERDIKLASSNIETQIREEVRG